MKEDLSKENIDYIYLDISENMLYLKQFLKLRDTHPAFERVKEKGNVGLPCFVIGDHIVFHTNKALDAVKEMKI